MEVRLLKPAEVDILFRYPNGRTMRLIRQGKMRFVTLPDGDVRIPQAYVDGMIREGGSHENE